jgi:MinD superfamily P-loop ATPase
MNDTQFCGVTARMNLVLITVTVGTAHYTRQYICEGCEYCVSFSLPLVWILPEGAAFVIQTL